MALPYKVDNLEKVPEAARSLYEKKGDVFVMGVEGVDDAPEVAALKSAFERTKAERDSLREKAGKVKDEDLVELDNLRKEKREQADKRAKEEGNWTELRARLEKEHQDALSPVVADRDRMAKVVESLTVTNALQAAIAAAGIKDEYRDAAEALLSKRGPKVIWEDGKPKGVFPDELHGDQPIADFVTKWAKSDAAKPFLPVKTKPGGGASGTEGDPGKASEFAGKKWSELTPEQKVALTEEKYGAGV